MKYYLMGVKTVEGLLDLQRAWLRALPRYEYGTLGFESLQRSLEAVDEELKRRGY